MAKTFNAMDFSSPDLSLNSSTGAADRAFGPQVQAQFDFTLLFESSILTILSTCVLLVLSPVYVYQLVQKPICVRRGLLLYSKLVRWTLSHSFTVLMFATYRDLSRPLQFSFSLLS